MAPKLVDVGRHPNIDLITYSELQTVKGTEGKYTVTIKKKARYVDVEKCTGCGVCAQQCPIDAINVFNEGLSDRRCIYVPYPQAVPLAYTIDREKCIGCGLCENLCLADAITYDDQEETMDLTVGSIILCPGFDEFESDIKSEYGHDRYENVLTSIEFERVLSASGPYKGHILRPSDGKQPKKVAWIQCVGSRDRGCGNNYCSSVCCTYAIKEAVIAKEHVSTIEPTIFYMDMRTFGKGFEEYYNRAQEEHGVRFIRCRIPEIQEDETTKNLCIRYETEDGTFIEEEFDLVVLSVGFMPKQSVRQLANVLDIQLNEYGFCQTSRFTPVSTSKPGIYVCGSFSGPKDIPETVMEASGAAITATSRIAPARHTLVEKKKYPRERQIVGEDPRIGVFICHCGINIGAYVDVPAVVDYAKTLPGVAHAEENLYTCSQDTQKKIVETIKEHNLNRVIVASCTPRTHEPLFQETLREAGLNPHLFEMANIRDQCSWVHMEKPQEATAKAKDLLKMAVAKARLIEPLAPIKIDIVQRALIIGGGLAGMTAALSIAEQGYEVFLVEREQQLGGNLNHIYSTIKQSNVQEYVHSLINKVTKQKNIHVYTNAHIHEINGFVGNFRTTIKNGKIMVEIQHGVIIIATGAVESTPTEYLYGKDTRVITQRQLEEQLLQKKNFKGKTIVMIQCVGSREKDRPYCSRICCTNAVKNALHLKDQHPDAQVYLLYRDMRTYGFSEIYYEQAREKGIIFIRYEPEKKPKVKKGKQDLEVEIHDIILDENLLIHADTVVLSPAIIPPKGNQELAKILKIPVNENGFFLEAHVKLRPVDFATDGVFLAGMAHFPKTIDETIAQSYAAVSRATSVLSKKQVEIEPRISSVDETKCIGCGLCESLCPSNAISLHLKEGGRKAEVIAASCKGCGICGASCPQKAITMRHFRDKEIEAQIEAYGG